MEQIIKSIDVKKSKFHRGDEVWSPLMGWISRFVDGGRILRIVDGRNSFIFDEKEKEDGDMGTSGVERCTWIPHH